MNIIRADIVQLEIVKDIVIGTIKEIYPRCYSQEAVNFFIALHNDENILKDINDGCLFLGFDEQQNVIGTITICENEISRLFVLSKYQRQGYGNEFMDFAEKRIAKRYDTSRLDASVPAKNLYLERNYIKRKKHSVQTAPNCYLYYDIMEKQLKDYTHCETYV